jgi:hypothetical protein
VQLTGYKHNRIIKTKFIEPAAHLQSFYRNTAIKSHGKPQNPLLRVAQRAIRQYF